MPKRDTKTNTGCPPKLNKRIWNMSIKNQIVDIVVQKKKRLAKVKFLRKSMLSHK